MPKLAFTDQAGGYYEVEVLEGEPPPAWTQGMTSCEVVPWAPAPLTKEQRITEVLLTQGRGLPRTLIQQVISFAEMVAAPMLATQYAVSLELAIMGIYARNKTYRECKDAETAIEAIEDEA